MTYLLLLSFAGVAMLAVLWVLQATFTRRGRWKFRFSIRSLLVVVALVSVVMGAANVYRRAALVQLTWLDITGPQANSLLPTESIAVDPDGSCRFVYCTRRAPIRTVAAHLLNDDTSASGITGYIFDDYEESITVMALDEVIAHKQLRKLRDSDTLSAGAFVIRGQVVDRSGTPLAEASIDLMGPYFLIKHSETRADGTFTISLTSGTLTGPYGSGYYLRIGAKKETFRNSILWNSKRFSLDSANPELVVNIVVPR